MALINCPECGKEISDKAAACPNCGCPVEAMPRQETVEVAPKVETVVESKERESNDALKGMEWPPADGTNIENKGLSGTAMATILIVVVIVIAAVIMMIAHNHKNKIDFRDFEDVVDSKYSDIASDGSYMTIDTNPYNIEKHFDSNADKAIERVNKELGIPASVYEKMGKTRALDGRQEEEHNGVKVSWAYHPDNGLEVMYEIVKE